MAAHTNPQALIYDAQPQPQPETPDSDTSSEPEQGPVDNPNAPQPFDEIQEPPQPPPPSLARRMASWYDSHMNNIVTGGLVAVITVTVVFGVAAIVTKGRFSLPSF